MNLGDNKWNKNECEHFKIIPKHAYIINIGVFSLLWNYMTQLNKVYEST
jgi:hypothetical protein